MSGFFLVHRGWMDSFKPEPFTEREAFLWSIEKAAFQAHDQWFNGHRIMVERGEFVTSLREMEKTFRWSLKRIRGFVDRMVKAEKWAQRRAYEGAQSPTIITVCNYAIYQNPGEASGTVSGTARGTRGAQSGRSGGTQQKEGNKGNKGKKEVERPSVSSTGSPVDVEADGSNGAIILFPSSASPFPSDPVQRAFEEFDDLRRECLGGTRAIALDADRRRKLVARLDDVGGAAGWAEVLAAIRASSFLRGEKTGRPIATIDWILNPTNLRKIREGNYADERSPTHAARGAGTSAADAMRAARAAVGLGGPRLRQ